MAAPGLQAQAAAFPGWRGLICKLFGMDAFCCLDDGTGLKIQQHLENSWGECCSETLGGGLPLAQKVLGTEELPETIFNLKAVEQRGHRNARKSKGPRTPPPELDMPEDHRCMRAARSRPMPLGSLELDAPSPRRGSWPQHDRSPQVLQSRCSSSSRGPSHHEAALHRNTSSFRSSSSRSASPIAGRGPGSTTSARHRTPSSRGSPSITVRPRTPSAMQRSRSRANSFQSDDRVDSMRVAHMRKAWAACAAEAQVY